MTDKNLKNDTNLTTNHQSDEATADKALFISEWKVDAGEKLYFPTQGREGEIVIDWGDGSSDTINSGDDEYISHKYSEDGIYTIKVDGMITKWSCNLGITEECDEECDEEYDEDPRINAHKLIKILSYGKTSFGPYTFKDACNLVGLPENESPRFFENSMEGVFYGASGFNQSIHHWDTSKITNMNKMFLGAKSFNKPLNDWNTSNVTNMSSMFYGTKSFNQPLNDWDTSNVTDMSRMFFYAESFNQPLNDWNTSNVTNMSGMFSGADAFNQPLNDWNTSNVTDMSSMFSDADAFNQPLNDWNTSNVTNMSGMFKSSGRCKSSFNQPLDKWDTSNVTYMNYMFFKASSFNQPLNDWNTSNVTNMSGMFSDAESFNQPLDKWDTSNVTNMSGIFIYSGLDEDNYSLLFNGPFSERWAELLGKKGWAKACCSSAPARAVTPPRMQGTEIQETTTTEKNMTDKNLKNDTNLTTNEQNKKCPRIKDLFISKWKLKADETLEFPIQGREGEIVIDWGDGSSDTISSGDDAYISHEYSEDGFYTIKVDGTITRWSCKLDSDDADRIRANSKKLIRILSYGKTSFGPYTFWCARNLIGLPQNQSPRFFENSMEGVFYKASSFDESINHWDTSNITDMNDMFNEASSFNQPLDKWDTSNVTDMCTMFYGASSFDQPLNDWNTSSVTDMSGMFVHASSFNQPLDKWDVSNVTTMNGMFAGASSFNQPLDKWNTSHVTDMQGMFRYALNFNQPLDKWDVSNVTDMIKMFSYAKKFNQPLDKWDISNVKCMDDIFTRSGLDEDNYSLLLNGPFSERWAELLDE